MNISSTRKRVLEVQELFEAILYQLPIRDLLLAQRASRKWCDTISSSPMLQEALFLRPTASSSSDTKQNYRFNELLAELFPPWFHQSNRHVQRFRNTAFKNLPWAESVEQSKAVLSKDASWRRMLVCQPPLKLVVRQTTSAMGGKSYREGRMKDEQGLRMGTLYDLTQSWIFGHTVASFGVEWSCFWKPSVVGIETDEVKRAIYDTYMGEGIALLQLKADPEDEFIPSPELRLNLSYVVQCVRPPKKPVGAGRYECEATADSDQVSLVFSESARLPMDAEYSTYISRKIQERVVGRGFT